MPSNASRFTIGRLYSLLKNSISRDDCCLDSSHFEKVTRWPVRAHIVGLLPPLLSQNLSIGARHSNRLQDRVVPSVRPASDHFVILPFFHVTTLSLSQSIFSKPLIQSHSFLIHISYINEHSRLFKSTCKSGVESASVAG